MIEVVCKTESVNRPGVYEAGRPQVWTASTSSALIRRGKRAGTGLTGYLRRTPWALIVTG